MSSHDAALKTYEVLAALHALPDKAALTTAEAALFLRLSPKTLERMRLDGSGPTYTQGGIRGARGGNQKCLYLKIDLLTWQQANQVSNSMEAAVRRGHAFRTVFDLIAETPFYVNASGVVAGAAEEVSLSMVIGRLGVDTWDLVWLPVVEAAGREWANLSAHQELSKAVLSALAASKEKITAALEATSIATAIRDGQ
ncbi:helix-turn-helix domain-containing protein [Paraburkholderia sp. GAS82]|uniref:helix-turn-helix domain-containing protein n=1 Tax=Paraburkholderia sp. GAS82 TaxID=3035137 RepID=UPI003D1F4022